MAKGSIQPGVEHGKIQVCPACGSKFVHVDVEEKASRLVCPNHPKISPTRFRVMFDKICHHHNNFEAAVTELLGFRHENMCGTFDERNYQIKAKPLSFARLADEWLDLKATYLRPGSMPSLRNALKRGIEAWGDSNIRIIKFAQIEDLLTGLDLSPKTKKNMLDALKQFWSWVSNRYEIPPIKTWPKLPSPEMAFRKTVSIADQEAILAEVHKITAATRIRSWIGIKWLCTYISIRPGEMLSLTEGNIDHHRGLLFFPRPKERRPKVVPLLDEDREILTGLPLAFPDMPFFRHEMNADKKDAGKKFGPNRFYRDWKEACKRLGFDDVDLYGGTKHSTAMGLRDVATYEEVRKMTGHTTNRAFDRYLRLEGESMKKLYARRQTVSDNGLTTEVSKSEKSKILNFKG